MSRILITAALPYANGGLHFGHIAGAYLPADVYARFSRLMKHEVAFICGSDEFGVPITINAERMGQSFQEYVDVYFHEHQKTFRLLSISFDHYSRTTRPGHKKITQEVFLSLLNNGHIEERVVPQLYSEKEGRFLADRYVKGECPHCGYLEARGDECPKCAASYESTELLNPVSKITHSPLQLKDTKHWFLRFDHFKQQLLKWLDQKSWKGNVKNFARFYAENVRARAITRDSTWGVPLPLSNTEGKVFYVWFDAPLGYISMTKEWAEMMGRPELWKDFWLSSETKYVQFIGKDNIPFHAVFFPAMLMGQDLPYKKVDHLPANEFLLLEGKQFSKSDGWFIDLHLFFDRYECDQIRYYLALHAPETQDTEFSWDLFQAACNDDLVGKWGNLANRTLTFLQRHCEGCIPAYRDLMEIDQTFLKDIKQITQEITAHYDSFSLKKAARAVMKLASVGNVYFNEKKPWQEIKQKSNKQDVFNTLYCCLEALKALALVSYPIMPNKADLLWRFLGGKGSLQKETWEDFLHKALVVGGTLPIPELLFSKIEDSWVKEEKERLYKFRGEGMEQEATKESRDAEDVLKENDVSFEDFLKVKMCVGVVLSAEKIIKSNKLLKLKVDLGSETRVIVSGIAKYFPEEGVLLDQRVVVVKNLKPVKIMGVMSQGMLLAAGEGEAFSLVKVDQTLSAGTVIS